MQNPSAYKHAEVNMTAAHERAITAVLLRYATGIDSRDWQLFATCFTDDVIANYGDIGNWHGRDIFVGFMEKGHAEIGSTMHRITNIVVTGDRDHAAATSYVDALLLPAQAGGMVRRASGRYEDKLIRLRGEWRIFDRQFISIVDTNSPS